MKSSNANLRKRGKAEHKDIADLNNKSVEELWDHLIDGNACIRSAAAVQLSSHVDASAEVLLYQLTKEVCLYTKIAICECLENGSAETVEKMLCGMCGLADSVLCLSAQKKTAGTPRRKENTYRHLSLQY